MISIRQACTLSACSLLLVTLGVVTAQNTTSAPSAAFTQSFADTPCIGDVVSFVASDKSEGTTHTWWVNGEKDPYGANLTYLQFRIDLAGYAVQHSVYRATLGDMRSLNFTARNCDAAPSATPTSGSASGAYAHIWVQKICLEAVTISGEHSQGPNGAPIASYAWSIVSPTGRSMSFEGRTIGFASEEEGYYKITLRVRDVNGAEGSAVRSDYYFYRCHQTASPTPTTACKEYYDNRTGNRTQYCETYSPPPTQTAQPAQNYERCRALQDDAQKFKADWSYRYDRARAEGNADEVARLDAEREQWSSYWQDEWRRAGCDYGGGGTGDACSQALDEHRQIIMDFESRIAQAWQSHREQLEQARREFSSQGYHNKTEWEMFEEKWRRGSAEIEERMRAEIEAFMSRYPRLAQCGYQYYHGGPVVADYQAQYGAAPQKADAYNDARSACEERMLLVKDQYAGRFEELYKRLMSVPETSDEYRALKQQIAQVESEVRSQMEALMNECRNQYETQYSQPDNYKEGAGELVCYFDEASQGIQCRGKYVSFMGDPQTQMLSRFSCGGQLFFDQLYSNTVFEDFAFEETGEGGALTIRSSNLKMRLHDSPRGVVNVGLVGDAAMYFVPAVHLEVTVDGSKVLMQGADSRGMWLGREGGFHWDPAKRVLTVRGEATWVSESCLPDGSKPDGDKDDRYWDAIQKRRLGAQVVISLDDEDDEVDQDNETYDEDMRVQVRRERANKFNAVIDSLDGACKTVVLKFDAAIFSSIKLKVTLQDEMRNEISIQEATDLEDVLDPCNDGEQGFEYWIVVDKYGTQVLVSFAHFSEKHVSVEAAAVNNIVVPGFELGPLLVTGMIAAAVVVLVRRRRAD